MTGTRRPARTALPSGTLTFLFTDIEGSTRLWSVHPEAMGKAVSRHDTLLRQCIAAHGGQVFKTVGDAFHAAFATAPDSVAAALSAQQALRAERWPEGLPIRVRLAVHTGAAEFRGGDYFGAPLNYVARLLALAHGGQTLISEITQNLCRDRLPVGATLKLLGEHPLKDVGPAEKVFQLCHAGLPGSFPPLQAVAVAPAPEATPSIAVLPFVNMSHDEENEYFADGLSEELLNVLAKIRDLRVASRTSAFHFKGKDVDIPTVAQSLNVATILEGSVRKSGKHVRITAQLIEVASDSHLWSETYDRELDDIFAVQDDIAQSVVKELRAALLGRPGAKQGDDAAAADVRKAATGRSDNAEAFQLYLQGKFYGERATKADTDKAIELFQRALAIDPHFALAWAALAHMHWAQAGNAFAPRDESYERAREAAQHALRLAPDMAEAHVELGLVHQSRDWNWTAAEASYRRALDLAPGNAYALLAAARLAQVLGRLDDARELARNAVALDPLSAWKHCRLALISLDSERFEDAAASFQLALDLAPNAGPYRACLASTRLLQGRKQEALSIAQAKSNNFDVDRNLALAMIHHSLGHSVESDAALMSLIDELAWDGPYQIAQVYAYRNEVDKAFEWLERAYGQHDPGVTMVLADRFLHSLHGDPRWQPFLQKMKLVDSHS